MVRKGGDQHRLEGGLMEEHYNLGLEDEVKFGSAGGCGALLLG